MWARSKKVQHGRLFHPWELCSSSLLPPCHAVVVVDDLCVLQLYVGGRTCWTCFVPVSSGHSLPYVRGESLSGARSSVGGGNSSIGSVFTARAVPCECLLGAKKTHPARGKV